MADSVYRVTEVVGVSSESWEAAARTAVETAAKSVRELRIAEVVRQDLTIEDGSGAQLPHPPWDLVQVRPRVTIFIGLAPDDRRGGPRAKRLPARSLASPTAPDPRRGSGRRRSSAR